jgi:hypothetical protein
MAKNDNFNVNIIKLCAKLRSSGLSSFASEIESKFVALKKAETELYNINTQTAEQRVADAHPDGSVNLFDDPEGEVETVTDAHKKIMDILEKMPTGKLASVKKNIKISNASLMSGISNIFNNKLTLETAQQQLARISGQTAARGGAAEGAKGAATVAGGVVLGEAALVASMILGEVIGGVAGYELFENKFYAKEITDGYFNLVTDIKDIPASEMQGKITEYVYDLDKSMNYYLSNKDIAASFPKDPTEANLKAIDDVANSLVDIMTAANNIRGWADAQKGYETGTSTTINPFKMVRRVQDMFSNYADLEGTASNLINLASTASTRVKLLIEDMLKAIREKSKPAAISSDPLKGAAESSAKQVADLTFKYDFLIKNIVLAKSNAAAKIQAGDISKSDGDQVMNYLDTVFKIVQSRSDEFKGIPDISKGSVVNTYLNKLTDASDKLSRFKSRWGI